MKRLLLLFILMCFAQTSYSLSADRHNHFFKNGFNSPVYGEFFLTQTSDSDIAKSLTGLKFGVQIMRFTDKFSMTLGGQYSADSAPNTRDSFGPVIEAIIFPEYFVHGSLSFVSGKGSIEPAYASEEAIEDKEKRLLYNSQEIGVNVMLNVTDQVNFVLGFVSNTVSITDDENKVEENFSSYLIGLRGTSL